MPIGRWFQRAATLNRVALILVWVGAIAGSSTYAQTALSKEYIRLGNRVIAIENATSALAVTTASLPSGTDGSQYSATLGATGGVPQYSWSVSTNTLPPGLLLSSNSGQISGTPTASGTYNFTVTVTDSTNATANKALSITISSHSPLVISPTSVPNGTPNATYSTTTLSVTGGTAPYTWSVLSGALPSGLNFAGNNNTATISGTPASCSGGVYSFTIQATDSMGVNGTQPFSMTIASPPQILTSSLPSGHLQAAYSQQLQYCGGMAPLTWSIISGSLPTPLTLAGPLISGTPAPTDAVGSYPFSIQLKDATNQTTSQALSIQIQAATGLTITTTSPLPNGTASTNYPPLTLSATGGTTPYTWSLISGSLPNPMGLNSSTGVLSATPLAPNSAGSYNFTIQVTDSHGLNTSQSFYISVSNGLTVTSPTTIPNGILCGTYPSTTFQEQGGLAPYFWSVLQGPPGLVFPVGSNVMTGPPTAAGNYTVSVQVHDSGGGSGGVDLFGYQNYSISIGLAADLSVPAWFVNTGTTTCAATNSITNISGISVTVTGSANVTFQAPGYVVLNPGFSASPSTGGGFKAVIE